MDIGLDVVVTDVDEDGSYSWMAWGPGTQKLRTRDRMGQGLLLARGTAITNVVDRVRGMTQEALQRAVDRARERTAYQMFFTGVLLSVTFLHLLLFMYYRQVRANLYYALFSGVAGGLIYYGFQLTRRGAPSFIGPSGFTEANQVAALVFGEALLVVCVLGLLFLYSLFYSRLPRQFWVLLTGLVASGVMGYLLVVDPSILSEDLGILLPIAGFTIVGTGIEFLRVVLRAVRRRQEGAWTMGVSFLAFGIAGIYGTTQLLGSGPIDESILSAVLIPLASMSVYLARSVARTRRALEVQNRALNLANDQIRRQNEQVEEANRLKSDFLARMSHDLRTPLNAIIGYTRILLRRSKDALDERQYRNLENIRVSADNLLALINDILDLSRIEAGRREIHVSEVDVTQLVQQCVASVESLVPEGVELITDYGPVPTLRSDADRLRRVLMNLLGNALKFTETGTITVSVRTGGPGVELAVADTGAGIPADDLPHIFDEFRQVEERERKREGSGLGLAIAHRSVEMLGGTIAATSEVGVGSTFTVQLPLVAPGAEPADTEASAGDDPEAPPSGSIA
jgi:signal transduction histidine kinase